MLQVTWNDRYFWHDWQWKSNPRLFFTLNQSLSIHSVMLPTFIFIHTYFDLHCFSCLTIDLGHLSLHTLDVMFQWVNGIITIIYVLFILFLSSGVFLAMSLRFSFFFLSLVLLFHTYIEMICLFFVLICSCKIGWRSWIRQYVIVKVKKTRKIHTVVQHDRFFAFLFLFCYVFTLFFFSFVVLINLPLNPGAVPVTNCVTQCFMGGVCHLSLLFPRHCLNVGSQIP